MNYRKFILLTDIEFNTKRKDNPTKVEIAIYIILFLYNFLSLKFYIEDIINYLRYLTMVK